MTMHGARTMLSVVAVPSLLSTPTLTTTDNFVRRRTAVATRRGATPLILPPPLRVYSYRSRLKPVRIDSVSQQKASSSSFCPACAVRATGWMAGGPEWLRVNGGPLGSRGWRRRVA